MDEFDGNLANWNRRGALEEIENLKTIRATAWDEHTHVFRWLMASLLAINGAACLAVVGQAAMPLDYRLWACGAFVTGILSALLVAVLGQRSIQNSLLPLQKYIGYWMTVADDGERDESVETALNNELKISANIGFASRFVGWISACAFLCGVLVAGFGMTQKPIVPSGSTIGLGSQIRP